MSSTAIASTAAAPASRRGRTVGVLVPRLAGAAAAGLVALMVGATVTNVAVLDETPLVSLGLLVAAGVVAWARRSELRGAFALLRR